MNDGPSVTSADAALNADTQQVEAVFARLEALLAAQQGGTQERRLVAALEGKGPLHFSVGEGDEDTDGVGEVYALLNRVRRALLTFAQVESRGDAGLVAYSAVGWGGGIETWVKGDADPHEGMGHADATRLAVKQRWLNLRLGMMTLAFAVGLSARLSTPGGVVSALPQVWRYVKDVLTTLEATRAEVDPSGMLSEGSPHEASLGLALRGARLLGQPLSPRSARPDLRQDKSLGEAPRLETNNTRLARAPMGLSRQERCDEQRPRRL